jgi:hypothetical protein
VCDAERLNVVKTIHEGVLEPDLMVRCANSSFGGTSTGTPKDTPRDKEGQQ